MFKKTLLPVIVFTFIISQSLLSQSLESSKPNCENEGFKYYDQPTIELTYGISQISLNHLESNFSDVGMLELKLGYTFQRKSFYGKNTLRFTNGFAFLNHNSSDLAYNSKRDNELSSEMWQFGIGRKVGYGLNFGSVSLVPYTSNSFVWSRLDMQDIPTSAFQDDIDIINRFNESFRFGSSYESGINFQLTRMISIQTQLNQAIVFERHQFGKHLISMLVEEGGLFLLETFTDNVLENDPVAGTIVTFLLKSGYSFGLYQLRTKDMYWPYKSDAPLSYISFKFGTSFTF